MSFLNQLVLHGPAAAPEKAKVELNGLIDKGFITRVLCRDIDQIKWGATESGMNHYYATAGKEESATSTPLRAQVGGGHYKDMKIQPIEYIHANGLTFIEGCVVKYVSRYKAKNGKEDLLKARHFIDMLIKLEYPDA